MIEWHGRVNSYECSEVSVSGMTTELLTWDSWTGDVPL